MTDNVGMHLGASEIERVENDITSTVVAAPGSSPTSTNYPRRKNIRAEFHDYSGGDYFVTICTHGKAHYFGSIYNDEMHLSSIGEFANQAMKTLHTPLFLCRGAIVCCNAKSCSCYHSNTGEGGCSGEHPYN